MPKALKQKIKLDLSQARRAAAEHKAILEGLSEAGEEAAGGMDEMGEELGEAAAKGRPAAEAVDEVGDAAERSSKKTGVLGRKLKELTLRISDMMDWGLGFATMLGGTFAASLASAAAYIGGTSAAAVSFESAMIDVRKTTGLTGNALDQLGDEFLRIASRVGVGRREVAEIGATAGQLGIEGTENIARFTETVAKMTKVTQMSADEASASLARIANAFDLPIEKSENLASVLNVLSNNSTALAGDLVETLTRGVAAAGKEIGVTVDEAAALGATLIDAGVSARRAGVSLRNVFKRISGNAATAAEQMGITEEKFREMISEDAVTALKEYMRTLQEMPDQMRAVRAAEVFGERAGTAVATLSGQLDKLTELLPQASSQLEEATSFSREFQLSLKAVSRQAGLVWAKIKEWATGQGQEFLPIMMKSLKTLNRWMRGVEEAGRALEKFRQREAELNDQLKDLETYQRLKAEQRDLGDEAELSAEKQRTLKRATDSLAEAYPTLAKETKGAREETVLLTKAIRSTIEAQKDLLSLQQQDVILEQANRIENLRVGEIGFLEAEYEKAEEKLQRLLELQREGASIADLRRENLVGVVTTVNTETEVQRTLTKAIKDTRKETERLKSELEQKKEIVESAKRQIAQFARQTEQTSLPELTALLQEDQWFSIDKWSEARDLAREIKNIIDETKEPLRQKFIKAPTASLDEGDSGDGDDDELTEEEKRAIENAREALRSYIRAQKIANAQTDEWKQALRDVHQAQDDIAKLKEIRSELGGDTVMEGTDKTIDQRIKAAKERLRLAQEEVKAAKDFTAEIKNGNEALKAAKDELSAEDIDASMLDLFTNRFNEYQKRVSELRAELEAGEHDADELERKLSKASENALRALRPILRGLVKSEVLTKEQMDEIVQSIRDVEDEAEKASEGGLEDVAEKVQAIAQAVDGVKQLANTFGDLGDEAEAALDSISTLASSVGRLVASGGSDIGAWVGALTSAASLIGQELAGDDEAEEQAREMVEKMEDNIDALNENTEALLESGRVGGEFSENEVQRMKQIAHELQITTRGDDLSGTATGFNYRKAKSLVDELSRMGVEGTSQISKILEKIGNKEVRKKLGFGGGTKGLINAMQALFTGEGAESLRERFGDFPALFDTIEELGVDLGMFGDSVAGAVEKMRFLQENGLANAQEAFQSFADKLLSLDLSEAIEGKDLGGAGIEGGPGLRELLKEAKGLDLSTPEGRKRLEDIRKAIAQAISEGEFDFGKLTPDELNKILDTLGTDFGGGAGEKEETTATSQVDPTITEYQANELLTLQHEQVWLDDERNDLLRVMADALGVEDVEEVTDPLLGQEGAEGLGVLKNQLDVQQRLLAAVNEFAAGENFPPPNGSRPPTLPPGNIPPDAPTNPPPPQGPSATNDRHYHFHGVTTGREQAEALEAFERRNKRMK
jgi:TP901 family phage tail tape measure protein